MLEYVELQEKFARTTDVRDIKLTSDEQLRKAAPLLDQTGASSLRGDFTVTGKVDESTVVFIVKSHDRPERTITMKNCAEKKVCAFFEGAVKEGLFPKPPAVCKNAGPCNGE